MRSPVRGGIVLLLAAVAVGIGCFRDPDLENVKCSTQECPPGFVCVSPPKGRCVRATSIDGSSTSDAPPQVGYEAGPVDRAITDVRLFDGTAFEAYDAGPSNPDVPLDGGSSTTLDASVAGTGGRGGEDTSGTGGADGRGHDVDWLDAPVGDAVDAPVGGAGTGGAQGSGGVYGSGSSVSSGGSGSAGTGGIAGTGGVLVTGGTPGTGGSGTGGLASTGGIVETGGVASTGGVVSTGGIVATGGVVSTGGIGTTGGMTGTGGVVGTGGTSAPITPADLVPDLEGFFWEATCTGAIPTSGKNCPLTSEGSSSCPAGGIDRTQTFNVRGISGQKYTVNIEVRGVVGTRCYAGGSRASTDAPQPDGYNNWWYVGGTYANPTGWWNSYELHVSPTTGDPSGDVYYFNAADVSGGSYCEREATYMVKYNASFKVVGGGSLTFKIHDQNCKAMQNCGSSIDSSAPCTARTIDLAGMSPQPPATSPAANQPVTNTSSGTTYSPQWMWITATSVAPSL